MTRRRLLAAAMLPLALAAWFLRPGDPVTVTLMPGLPAAETARLLEREGVIGSSRAFRALAKVTRLDRKLKPGSYRLRKNMASPHALWRLSRGRPEWVRVVIPEGFSARQIAERLEAVRVASAQAFEEYVRRNRLEGYLFPTTYFLGFGMEAGAVAHLMHEEFRRNVEPVFQSSPQSRLSLDQAVILASIVEREAVLPEEKPMIAAVYLNRLSKRMRLEADPTVQYSLGRWKKRLSRKDLQFDSPHNTYVRYGLPPGPICSPGLDSIRAVLAPAKTDALYFVADHTGGHTFSADYGSHLRAVAAARRKSRGAGAASP